MGMVSFLRSRKILTVHPVTLSFDVIDSIFLRDCSQCRVMVACQQFRSRDCSKMDILLHCSSQPVIESCTKMKFGCFTASYPQLEGQFIQDGYTLCNGNI